MNTENKFKKLALSLLFDAIGLASFAFPFLDIAWAPLSAYLMTKMYKGKEGKIAAVVSFIEEAVPFLDVVPTFTLMWLYIFVFKKSNVKKTVEV